MLLAHLVYLKLIINRWDGLENVKKCTKRQNHYFLNGTVNYCQGMYNLITYNKINASVPMNRNMQQGAAKMGWKKKLFCWYEIVVVVKLSIIFGYSFAFLLAVSNYSYFLGQCYMPYNSPCDATWFVFTIPWTSMPSVKETSKVKMLIPILLWLSDFMSKN